MPAWKSVLGEAQIADLVAYISRVFHPLPAERRCTRTGRCRAGGAPPRPDRAAKCGLASHRGMSDAQEGGAARLSS